MDNNNKEITISSHERNGMEMETKNDDVLVWKMQEKLGSLSSSDDKSCIYKVPEFIREQKEECYRPSVVSIGPIFYQHPRLETMQELKWIILRSFLQHHNNACPRLDDYIEAVRRSKKDIRDCYEEQKMLSCDDEFVQMIVLDAVFLITFITMGRDSVKPNPFIMDSRSYKRICPLQPAIDRDLLVEENQLPFFALEVIFGKACPSTSLFDAALRFIKDYDRFKYLPVDLRNLRYENVNKFRHLLDLWWQSYYLPHASEWEHDNKAATFEVPVTAKQLLAAGVTFKANSISPNPFDIKFDKNTGELQIPHLKLHNNIETQFRSLLFFEGCHYSTNNFTCVIDFLIFLDSLVDTEEDIKVLLRHEVLRQQIGFERQAVDFFTDIGKSISYLPRVFNYSDVSRQLNAYANQPWNRWKAILKKDYFNHPWAIVSFIFAVILFILTLLQTITSFTKN